MAGERIVFTEESDPNQYLKLVASGELDEYLLEALANYVNRQLRRMRGERSKLFAAAQQASPMSLGGSAEEFAANSSSVSFVITHAQKRMLREKGYSDAQIAEMAPAEAHNILGFMG